MLDQSARVCVVDPLGVWWGLRAGPDGGASLLSYPMVVFGGRHADVPLDEGTGTALGQLIGAHQIACVVDVPDLGSAAARRGFMTAFTEALYAANTEPLHLVLDEADLWAPQRAQPDGYDLLQWVEEILRRGRVRGFVPWLITIRRPKGDQEGRGATIAIPAGRRLKPVAHLDAWLGRAAIADGLLFRRLSQCGTRVLDARMSHRSVAEIVKARAKAAGLDPAAFAGHSLRAGFLTSVARAGASVWTMQEQSRQRA